MKLTIDVENTAIKLESGKILVDPFTPNNKLVLVCTKQDDGTESSFWFNHSTHSTDNAKELLQAQLDQATVLICHNAQHELIWLWDTGFVYDGPVFDTMLVEYLFQRGQKEPLSLEAIAEKWELENQKLDTLKVQLKRGITVDNIDGDELQKYCLVDVKATYELAMKLRQKMFSSSYSSLQNIIELTNALCVLLAKIYYRGFSVDTEALMDVKREFQAEKQNLLLHLEKNVQELMGDTPINLASPEQLSSMIYSRKPNDKATWANSFSKYMKKADFDSTVRDNSTIVYKTTAISCKECQGKGYNLYIKKDGSIGKAKRICRTCDQTGIVYIPQKQIAGLKFAAPEANWVANHGFSTNKLSLELLEAVARRRNMPFAQDFLHNIRRLSALDTYLSSFVDGISTFTKADKKLHVRLVQHRTTTGRLASDSPNLQNMPRAKTFPIKKVFHSRWPNGQIIEADFAQLEFRTAAFLSNDTTAKNEIQTGFDVHSYTADIITEAGQPITRQEAKAHTFAPLFGATGYGRTKAEAAYYEHFIKKYAGISAWHTSLANEVMETGMVTTPTGRQFAFPDAKRRAYGGVTYFTNIKNYPVQSLSTDIVQLTLLLLEQNMRTKKLHSVIVNSVHDSVVVDTYPNEEEIVLKLIKETEQQLKETLLLKFQVEFDVPLTIECKTGPNWMDVA
jgi:DNA polymerase I-like protein with 3'-5' exonuclease and polymerase domains